jgi:nucleoid-associated protein YgaU
MLRTLTILALLALLCACAKPPHQELDAAVYMLKRAQILQAAEFAPTEYQAAHTALADARRSMEKTDYRVARGSLEFSLQHSRRAIKLTEEGKARQAAEEARRAAAEKAHQAELKAQQEKAEKAEKPKATQSKNAVVKKAPKPKPKIVPVANYDVGEGETLWTISALPQVYNEGMLWPLLYQANRDQIKDPRQIFPGQTLSVRRDMTEKELEEARQKARESDIFPVP